MKVILSRKGFDSSYGGYPSPIVDGKMVSFPIPGIGNDIRYNEVKGIQNKSLQKMFQEMKIRVPGETCHLDPDLNVESIKRKKGWKPAFGQSNQSLTHLKNSGVGAGDLFLFFGWFREAEVIQNTLRYKKGSESFHAIFGYLEIEQTIVPGPGIQVPDWLEYHPHIQHKTDEDYYQNNAIFIANEKLSLNKNFPGGDTLKFHESNRLSAIGKSRSKWDIHKLPYLGVNISYHNHDSWKDDHFQSANIGQEFVMEADEKVLRWALERIKAGIDP